MPGAKKPGLTRQPQGGAKKKLTLTSVNDKQVKAPKGTKTVTSSGGKLVYKDKHGRPIRKGNTNAPKKPSARRAK